MVERGPFAQWLQFETRLSEYVLENSPKLDAHGK